MPQPNILTINGGSSSIKFAVYHAGKPFGSGQIQNIGTSNAHLTAKMVKVSSSTDKPVQVKNTGDAVRAIGSCVTQWSTTQQPHAIVHRVVHGGPQLFDHQLITAEVLTELKRISPLDPSHLPGEIELIEAYQSLYPDIPHIACFDTAFHHALPQVAQQFPIPHKYFAQGVRRYGFHGLSYTYLMQQLARLDPHAARGKIILAHLGSGSSMAAVHQGKPIDTTMAFTPLAGLMMGTRPGDLDPGLLIYLMRQHGMSPDTLDKFLNKECGLLGVSGSSPDMRDITAAMHKGDKHAAAAFDLYCHTARKHIGALAASLDGLDTLVFSGGIGENAPLVRAAISSGLTHLGIHLSTTKNNHSRPLVSTPKSKVAVHVIPTDEESIMAQTALTLL